MKCNICGNAIAENTVFCPYCGTAIKKETKKEGIVNNVETIQESTNSQINNIIQNNVNEVIKEPVNEQVNNNQSIQSNTAFIEPISSNNNINLQQNEQTNQNGVNDVLNYDANNIYNMQNYQSVQTQSGYNYNNLNNNYNNQYIVDNNQKSDKVNVILAILSFFIPLVGIILFFTMKKSSEKTSKACGIVAIIAILLNSILLTIGIVTFKNIINTSNEYETTEDYEYTDNYIWESYEVKFNNNTIKLPCTYNDFVNATNFNIKPEVENKVLNNNYYNILNVYSNDKLAGMINLYNISGSDLLYKETNVSRISQTKYNVQTNNVEKFVFPGDLSAGMKYTKDEIIELLGEPAKINDSEYNNIKTYVLKYTSKDMNTTSGYYEITIIGDVINELSLDNRQ